jgi:hypothetical protein
MNVGGQNKVLSESYDGNHFTVNNHTQNDEHRDDRHSSRRSSSTLKRVINDSIKRNLFVGVMFVIQKGYGRWQ